MRTLIMFLCRAADGLGAGGLAPRGGGLAPGVCVPRPGCPQLPALLARAARGRAGGRGPGHRAQPRHQGRAGGLPPARQPRQGVRPDAMLEMRLHFTNVCAQVLLQTAGQVNHPIMIINNLILRYIYISKYRSYIMLERKYIYSITANVKYQTSIHTLIYLLSNISTFDIYTV